MSKNKNSKTSGCIESFSSCTVWNGVNIPCLNIETGDCLNDVIFNIADKICEALQPIDLSNISLQCLIDKLGIVEPSEKTIPSILQILIDNDCKLYDLIKLVESKIINPNTILNLDLKCLVTRDIFGTIPQVTQLQLDQLLIDKVCSLQTRVGDLEIKVIDLQNQIDNIELPPYTEPVISSCLYSNKPVSQAVNLTSTKVCQMENKIGNNSQIDVAIGRQCASLASLFITNPNFIQNPSTLAETNNNQWIIICNLLDRLVSIEQTCCAPSCDKIKIGFIYSYDADTRELILEFTSGAGTFIPSGFTDCGSQFSIKDCDGNIILTNTSSISNNASISFTLPLGVCTDKLNISIKTKFCLRDNNNVIILTCQDCYNKDIKLEPLCCEVTNSGSVPITIIYKKCTTTI